MEDLNLKLREVEESEILSFLYEISLDTQVVGSFRVQSCQKEHPSYLLGWADQYRDEFYYGDKDALLQFLLSLDNLNEYPSFIFISELELGSEFKTENLTISFKKALISQLEALRLEYGVTLTVISVVKTNEMVAAVQERLLKEIGYQFFRETDLDIFFVSANHVCAECEEHIPMDQSLCPTCDYQRCIDQDLI